MDRKTGIPVTLPIVVWWRMVSQVSAENQARLGLGDLFLCTVTGSSTVTNHDNKKPS